MKIARLDVIVITRDRPEWLRRCLESLGHAVQAWAGRPPDVRVWVGVNGRDDPTERLLADWTPPFPGLELRVRRIDPARSPAAARNALLGERAALSASPASTDPRDPSASLSAFLPSPIVISPAVPEAGECEWVYFIDDDAFVEAAHFARFARALEDFPACAVIGGPNLTPPGSPRLPRAAGRALACRFATWFSVRRYRSGPRSRICHEESLILCNLFVRLDHLGSAPFPEGFVCNEENWLLQTVADRGGALVYAVTLPVWHERRAHLGEFIRQVFKYGWGRGQNVIHRPGTFRPPHAIPSLCLGYAAWGLARWLCAGSPPSPLVPLASTYLGLCLALGLGGARAQQELPALGGREELCTRALCAALFPVIHVSYGAGFLRGLAGGR